MAWSTGLRVREGRHSRLGGSLRPAPTPSLRVRASVSRQKLLSKKTLRRRSVSQPTSYPHWGPRFLTNKVQSQTRESDIPSCHTATRLEVCGQALCPLSHGKRPRWRSGTAPVKALYMTCAWVVSIASAIYYRPQPARLPSPSLGRSPRTISDPQGGRCKHPPSDTARRIGASPASNVAVSKSGSLAALLPQTARGGNPGPQEACWSTLSLEPALHT